MPALGQLRDPLEVAGRLRHLPAADVQELAVDPDPGRRPADDRRGLGDLVLVVGEDVVDAAGVDVEPRRRGGAGPSPSTRGASPGSPRPSAASASAASGPRRRPSRARSRPESRLSGSTSPRWPARSSSSVLPDRRAVAGERGDRVVHVAVVAARRRGRRRPAARRGRSSRGCARSPAGRRGRAGGSGAPRRRGRPPRRRRRSRRASCPRGPAATSIRSSPRSKRSSRRWPTSVMFWTCEDRRAVVQHDPPDQVGEEERPEVADVGVAVDGRAAGVHPDAPASGGSTGTTARVSVLRRRRVTLPSSRMSGESCRPAGASVASATCPSATNLGAAP